MKICLKAGKGMRGPKPKLPPDSRFVDVQKMQLVAREQAGEFAALSYVWGKCKDEKLCITLLNVEERQQVGGLSRARYPKTIADAINLTKELEIRYLWIDALCIVQDGDNLEDEIQSMDRMFGSASLVLVAAAGVDQEAGLTGYRDTPRTRTNQRIANVQGLRVVATSQLHSSKVKVEHTGLDLSGVAVCSKSLDLYR